MALPAGRSAMFNFRGPTGTFDEVDAVTRAPGSGATAVISGPPALRSVVFGIPDGDSVSQVGIIESGDLMVTFESGKALNAGRVRGADGLDGAGGVTTDAAIGTAIGTAGTSASKTAVRNVAGIIDGLVADDVTDNRATIQAALDKGGRWELPATAGRYCINGPLEVSVPGTSLSAWGAPIRQGVNGQSIFDIAVPDVTIDGVDAIGSLTTLDVTGMTAAWEMSIISSRWTVINAYSGADRLNVPWIRGRGFSSVARVTNWDRNLNGTSDFVADVNLGTLLCENVEFGFVVQGTKRFSYGKVVGSYRYPIGGTRPPHLLYFSGTGDNNLDVIGGDASATYEGGAGGQAFQFKGVTRGQVGTLRANGCPGIANLMDNHDLEIGEIVSLNDAGESTSASLVFDATVEQKNVVIHRARIHLATDRTSVKIIAGDSITLKNIDIEVAHTTSAATYDVDIRGTNNTLDGLTILNTGASSWRGLGLWSGAGHTARKLKLKNMRMGVEVRGTCTNAVVDYVADDVTLHPTDGFAKLVVAAEAAPTLRLPTAIPLLGRDRVAAYDTFTIAPASGTSFGPSPSGHVWVSTLGSWVSDLNGKAYESAGIANSNAHVVTTVANAEVSVGVKLALAEGILFRWVDAATYLVAYLTTTGTVIAKRDGSLPLATLATGPAVTYPVGRRYELRVQFFGDRIDVFVDNVLSVSHTLSAGDQTKYGASVRHGLRSSGGAGAGRFDNFVIKSLA
jgi:hypothetical protein